MFEKGEKVLMISERNLDVAYVISTPGKTHYKVSKSHDGSYGCFLVSKESIRDSEHRQMVKYDEKIVNHYRVMRTRIDLLKRLERECRRVRFDSMKSHDLDLEFLVETVHIMEVANGGGFFKERPRASAFGICDKCGREFEETIDVDSEALRGMALWAREHGIRSCFECRSDPGKIVLLSK